MQGQTLQDTSQEAVSPEGQNRARVDVQILHRCCWIVALAAWVSNSLTLWGLWEWSPYPEMRHSHDSGVERIAHGGVGGGRLN
jgi:hypothetical protein